MKVALTIAGSDSTAGAGVQADLKTFAAFGVYGTSAVTAVTAQSTTGVVEVFPLPPNIVRAQIEQIFDDIDVAAVKTGMLATAHIVNTVADAIQRFSPLKLVVDPVITSSSGAALLSEDGVSVVKNRLLPLATVVTPNVSEAAALSGMAVRSLADAQEAAKRIADLGARAVLVKGGHLPGPHAVDLLLHSGTFTEFSAVRSPFERIHGTGCTFASAIAASLALDDDLAAAVGRAKEYITAAIEQSTKVGKGARVLNHFGRRYTA